jgi:hypothetical protein
MDERGMIEAMGEALLLKNDEIRMLEFELAARRREISELKHKLMLAEADNIRLRRAMEAMEWPTR